MTLAHPTHWDATAPCGSAWIPSARAYGYAYGYARPPNEDLGRLTCRHSVDNDFHYRYFERREVRERDPKANIFNWLPDLAGTSAGACTAAGSTAAAREPCSRAVLQRSSLLGSLLIAPILLNLLACSPLPRARTPAEGLYQRRCGNCHELHPVNTYSDADWAVNVQRMRGNAGLTESQAASLIDWLKASNDR